MDRLRHRDLRALLAFLEEAYACHDLDGLVTHVIRHLAPLIPGDLTAYNEINPRRRRIVWRDAPALVTLMPDGRQVFERHMADHPLIAHYQRTRDGRARKISDFLTLRQFRRTGLYQEFFRRFEGGDHQLVVTLPAPPPLLIGVSVNRSRPDFSDRERLVMDVLRPHLARAYRNAELVTDLRAAVALGERALAETGIGVVTVGRDGIVRSASAAARDRVTAYFGRWDRRLPDGLRRWMAAQEARLSPAGHAPAARAPLAVEGGGRRLVVRLLSEAEQRVLLLVEEPAPLSPSALAGRLGPHGLTRREAEVLAWVAEGKTNAEIATILGTRRKTVSKQLERVFDKLGVETRTAAAMRALELARAEPGL
jgi:DNA-binding CsgD family transcriptional regulator